VFVQKEQAESGKVY